MLKLNCGELRAQENILVYISKERVFWFIPFFTKIPQKISLDLYDESHQN